MAAPADSAISAARANADAKLKKALSVIDPLDFSGNVATFEGFIHATKLLFNEEVSELLHTCIDSRTFKESGVARLHKEIVDEYAKPPSIRKMTKRERQRFERPMTMDEKPPFQATDKWDLFAPTILLPNKKHFVRKALRRVLGDQLRYWLRKAAHQFDRQTPADDHKPSNESPGSAASNTTLRLAAVHSREIAEAAMPDLPSWKDLQTHFLQYATEHAGLRAIWAWKYTRDDHSLLGPPEGYWVLDG